MKRTGEVILTTIALFFTYLGTILISTVLLFSNLDEIRKLFQEDYVKEEALPVTFESIDAFLNLFISLRWLVLLTVIVGTVLGDRKSTRLNSSHVAISYAVFCLK